MKTDPSHRRVGTIDGGKQMEPVVQMHCRQQVVWAVIRQSRMSGTQKSGHGLLQLCLCCSHRMKSKNKNRVLGPEDVPFGLMIKKKKRWR